MLHLFFLFALLCVGSAQQFELRFHAQDKSHVALLDRLGLERTHSPGVWKGTANHTRAARAAGVHVEFHDMRDQQSAFDGYHSNAQAKAALEDLALSSRGSVQHVGTSVRGVSIDAVRLGPPKPGAPRVAVMAGIHGDEVVGPELVLEWAKHLLHDDPTGVIDNIEVFLLPRINPDGFDARRRENANGVDLNRNFPDRFMGEDAPDQGKNSPSAPRQPETSAVMNWLSSVKPHLAVVIHGGSTVCNYPYDGNEAFRSREYAATQDDALYRRVCASWASLNPEMMGNFLFDNGMTNGAAWYVLYGGLQDWAYLALGAVSITTEVSRDKWPTGIDVAARYGPNNFAGMSAFARTSLDGLRGRITNQRGSPVAGTVTEVDSAGRARGFVSAADAHGYYVRMMAPGTHELVFAAPGCTGKRLTFTTEADASYVRDIILQCN